jgi:L-ascorbate metabolism protein UlaG (beta-lactamase superfamily)
LAGEISKRQKRQRPWAGLLDEKRKETMQITFLGHAAFRVDMADAHILIDPFFTGNPVFTSDIATVTKGVTHIVLTHGHDDHVGDTAKISIETGAQIVANPEICGFLSTLGVKNLNPGNTGGTVDCGPFTTSFVQALHSSGTIRNGASIYLGNPLGIVLKASGEKTLYHMGDTDIFGDMALVDELYHPKIGIVPIGDRFTMGPKTAALAVKRFFKFEAVIPCHFGTFPMLTGTVAAFKEALGDQAALVKDQKIGQIAHY